MTTWDKPSKKLRLIWARDELEADRALNGDFVAAGIIAEHCDQPAPWRNMVIEGDNFDVLRWLRMTKAGRIKCIIIDPPYNTGHKDWIYNDHYNNPEDRYFQSTWLEFLFCRLTLARDLLTDDGVILICINDEQRAVLELMANEALPGMRMGSLVWRTRNTTNARNRNFSDVHEHILIYAKSDFVFTGAQKSAQAYRNPDHNPRGPWRLGPLTLAFSRDERPNLYYPLHDPRADVWYPCDPDQVWRFASQDRLKPGQKIRSECMEDYIARGQVVFPQEQEVVIWHSLAELHEAIAAGQVPVTPRSKMPLIRPDSELEFWVGRRVGLGRPSFKRFWHDLRSHRAPLSSWIARAYEDDENNILTLRTGSGGAGTNEIQAIFGYKAFPHPKPKGLIKQLIAQSAGDKDIILDFFAGSGTLGHAVMELNRDDGGDRRFILASSPEATEREPDKNLCRDITAERIRRLNSSLNNSGLLAEFAYLRMRKLSFEDLDHDLSAAELWTALESLHDLPLTPYEGKGWQEHRAEGLTLIFADRVDEGLIAYLRRLAQHSLAQRPLAGENVFVYAWAPGQIREALGDQLDVRSVRDELVRKFRS